MNQNWSTVIATAALVLVAVAIVQRHRVSPVVVLCGVLPLGAAVAMFNTIIRVMQVASVKGEELSAATDALAANFGKAFTGTLAIAVGLAAGMAIIRLFKRDEAEGV